MRLLHTLVAVGLGISAAAMHATPVSYTFTTSGTGQYVSETETGNGTITFNAVPGGTSTITGFTFSDTITGSDGSSSFSYNFGELTGTPSAVFALVGGNLTLTNLSFATAYEAGTNSAFGNVNFSGAYSGPSAASTMGSNALATDYYADFTNGTLSLTQTTSNVATGAAPEPESLTLLGTGMLGVLAAARRRLIRA